MASKLSDPAIKELSLVFALKDGAEWAPRNEEARVLAVKGEAAKPERGMIRKAFDAFKAYFADNSDVQSWQWPVTEAPDNIDGDGDGPDDYNQIVSAICNLFYDLQGCYQISQDEPRSNAIVGCIDSFLAGLDKMRKGEDDDTQKAGARHSEADMEKLKSILDAQTGIGTHIEAIAGALKDLGITGAHGDVEGEQGPKQGYDSVQGIEPGDDADKAKKEADGKYGDVAYADEKNKKYPIDTEEHARAAWSYINQEKNAAEYSADELKEVRAKIMAACKKFGIEISDDTKKAEEIDMDQEALKALVAEAAKAGAEAATAKLTPQIEAAQAKAEEATQAAQAATVKAEAAQAEADTQKALADQHASEATRNAAALAMLGGSAPTKKSGISASLEVQKAGRLQAVFIEQMRNNPESTVI